MIIYSNTKTLYEDKPCCCLKLLLSQEFCKMASFFLCISSGFHGKIRFVLSGLIWKVQPLDTLIFITQF